MSSHLWHLKDLEMDGRLGSYLIKARKSGLGIRAIAQDLSEAGTPVSKSTVANWISQSAKDNK